VRPRQHRAVGHDGDAKAGTKIEVYAGITADQCTPRGLGLGRGLHIVGQADLHVSEGLAQLLPQLQFFPTRHGRRQGEAVFTRYAESAGADRGKRPARYSGVEELLCHNDSPLEAGLRAVARVCVDGRRTQPVTVEIAYRSGDLGAAEVQAEHDRDRGLAHVGGVAPSEG
jgi:hypothetical protein